jgi:hypothetical protein
MPDNCTNEHRIDQRILVVYICNAIFSWISILSYSVAVSIEFKAGAIFFLFALYIPIGFILTLIFGVMDFQSWISRQRYPLLKKTTAYNAIAILAYLVWLVLLIWLPPLTA